MKTNLRLWVLLSVVVAIPATSSAIGISTPWEENASVNVTQSATLRYQIKDFDGVQYDDDLLMWLNKLNVGFDAAPVRAGVRIDSSVMMTAEDCAEQAGDSECPIRSEYGFERVLPEKAFLTWSGDGWSVTAGDVYTSWGQGLVLNLKKVDELGVDTTLRGGRIKGRYKGFSAEAVAGQTNIQNLELFRGSYEVIEDPDDLLAGLQTSLALPLGIEVGVRGVHAAFETPETLGHEESQTLAGGSLEFPQLTDYFALYGEGAVSTLRDEDQEDGDIRLDRGSALYGRMNGFFGPVTLLVEGKRYRGFEFVTRNTAITLKTPVFYHLAPTLERFDQQVFNNTDTTGGRAKLEWAIRSTKTRLYVNGMWNVYAPVVGVDPWGKDGRTTLHTYGGFRQKFGRNASLEGSGGWREERDRLGEQDVYRKLWHVEADWSTPLVGSQGLAVKGEFRNEVKSGKAFSRALQTVTYSVQPGFSLSALLGYSTERVEVEPTHHAAGQVDVGMGDWGTLRLFGGSVPGGIVCAGGTCVYVPAAVSYRADIVARF